MRTLLLLLLFGILVFTFGATYLERSIENGSVAALLITGVNTKALNDTIIEHYRTNILQDEHAFIDKDTYTLELSYTSINEDDERDVIARMRSDRTCGSGGCITTIFLQNDIKGFESINFEYATQEIEVLDTITYGMHDIRINSDDRNRMSWDGTKYTLESI